MVPLQSFKHSMIMPIYGFDYLKDEYPETYAQVQADAAAEFGKLEQATWSFDSNLVQRWNWIKAEYEGEELYIDEDIKATFTGKTHKKIRVKIIHLVLWLFRNLINIFTK